jgi:hypothetical protein
VVKRTDFSTKALENYFKVKEIVEEIGGDSILLIRNNNLLTITWSSMWKSDLDEYYTSSQFPGWFLFPEGLQEPLSS